MNIERALRLLAGIMIILSLALGYWISEWFYLLTAFVGLNLLQSSLTNTCPAVWFFDKLGMKRCVEQK